MVIRTQDQNIPYDGLLQSQKNEVFNVISEGSLDPDDFDWTRLSEDGDGRIFVDGLVHKPSGFVFVFGKNRNAYISEKFRVRYSPDLDKMFGVSNIYDWEGILYEIYAWTERVKKEWEAPDLWEQAKKGSFDSASDLSNEKFSKAELTVIRSRMNEVRTSLLQSAADDSAKIADINHKVDYLIGQSSKQGRRDWLMLVYGYIFTNIANWGLSQEHFHAILQLLITGIQTLVRGM